MVKSNFETKVIEVAIVVWTTLFAALYACAPAIAALPTIITIDHAACELAKMQSSEPAWEVFVCSVLGADGRRAEVTVRVPREQAEAFARAHAGPPIRP